MTGAPTLPHGGKMIGGFDFGGPGSRGGSGRSARFHHATILSHSLYMAVALLRVGAAFLPGDPVVRTECRAEPLPLRAEMAPLARAACAPVALTPRRRPAPPRHGLSVATASARGGWNRPRAQTVGAGLTRRRWTALGPVDALVIGCKSVSGRSGQQRCRGGADHHYGTPARRAAATRAGLRDRRASRAWRIH